jgi:hypothetical protein
MRALRPFVIFSWIALPTVMFGGYSYENRRAPAAPGSQHGQPAGRFHPCVVPRRGMGNSLLNLIARGGILSPFAEQFFRAGHAHAGVLLIMSLAYYHYLGQTTLPDRQKVLAAAALVVGILAQSGGFFLHMAIGQPGQLSPGNYLTIFGAALLALTVLFLVYALVRHWQPTT